MPVQAPVGPREEHLNLSGEAKGVTFEYDLKMDSSLPGGSSLQGGRRAWRDGFLHTADVAVECG